MAKSTKKNNALEMFSDMPSVKRNLHEKAELEEKPEAPEQIEKSLPKPEETPVEEKEAVIAEEITDDKPVAETNNAPLQAIDPNTILSQYVVVLENGKPVLKELPATAATKPDLLASQTQQTPNVNVTGAVNTNTPYSIDTYAQRSPRPKRMPGDTNMVKLGEKTFDLTLVKNDPKYAEEYKKELATAIQNGIIPEYKKKELYFDPTSKETGDEFLRQTYYISYEEVSAIERISSTYHIKKSDLVRQLLDTALEDYFPGILTEVKEDADKRRQEAYMKIGGRLLQNMSNQPNK